MKMAATSEEHAAAEGSGSTPIRPSRDSNSERACFLKWWWCATSGS